MENKNPLSPHIQVYRWHISSLVSISHRITGIINIAIITLVCLWASLLLLGETKYEIGLVCSLDSERRPTVKTARAKTNTTEETAQKRNQTYENYLDTNRTSLTTILER